MELEQHDDFPSIVLLLRKPQAYDQEELRLAAQRAWGVPFETKTGEGNFVIKSGHLSVMKAGRHLLSFPSAAQRYSGDPRKKLKQLPRSQRHVWVQHRAWVAVDYLKGGKDRPLEYGVLARIAVEMLTDNCVGVFLPESGAFVPNDGTLGSLDGALRQLAADRDTGIDS